MNVFIDLLFLGRTAHTNNPILLLLLLLLCIVRQKVDVRSQYERVH